MSRFLNRVGGAVRMPVVVLCFLVSAASAAPAASAATDRDAPHVCAACGEPVGSAWFRAGKKYYHRDHFLCSWCKRPIQGDYTRFEEKNYHTDCFRDHVALRCALCGETIRGEYILDFWGHAYHARHKNEAPECDSCSRFLSPDLTGGGVRYDDGRYICNLCRPTSVTEMDEILALIDEVAGYMQDLGIDVDYKGTVVHLIGRQQMQELSGEHSAGLRGFTDYRESWRLFGRARGRKIELYLLYAMPRMELISTIAHELMHVWQFNRGRFKGDAAWREGSCNYAALLVLEKYDDENSRFFQNSLATDPDPEYGGGFRRIRDLVEEHGLEYWLSRLSRQSSFPGKE